MKPDEVTALAQTLTVLAAAIAGLWATHSYRQSLRTQATRWTIDLFKGFYSDPAIDMARNLLEYDYRDRLVPVLELRVLDRGVALTPAQRDDLASLDLLLNYLEQILYLEDRRAIGKGDKEVFFSYWLEIFSQPTYSSLRRYLACCGYERLAKYCGATDTEHVLFYGTLMGNSPRQSQLSVADKLKLIGEGHLPGTMYELPTCPGITPDGMSRYRVEIYQVLDRAALPILDEFEEYFPDNQERSRFIRRSVWVPELGVDAWTYFLAESARPVDAPAVTDASWTEYVNRTGKVLPDSLPPNIHLHEFGN